MKRIILIGPPGSGKGTQAMLLVAKYNIPHISAGHLLRARALIDDEIGNYVKDCIKEGKLVKEEITQAIVEERLNEEDCQNDGYILDGFPRSIVQAKLYEDYIYKTNSSFGTVIFLDISKEEALARIQRRIICSNCGQVFTRTKDTALLVCNICHTPLVKRADDNETTFIERYDVYQEETKPLLDYYEAKNLLHRIDGSLAEKEVFKQIEAILDK